jgi:FeS assembly SUF system protein
MSEKVMDKEFLQLEGNIVEALKTVYDPEIPVNIYDLGLIYELEVDNYNNVDIQMTLTAPNCPVADDLLRDVKSAVQTVDGVQKVVVQLVFDPPWSQEMLSEEAKLELGFL